MVKDINIVLSIVNMKLRDFYDSLDAFLDDFDEASMMVSYLEENGYFYDEKSNSFKQK